MSRCCRWTIALALIGHALDTSAQVPDSRLRGLTVLSKKEHAVLLGTSWVISDGDVTQLRGNLVSLDGRGGFVSVDARPDEPTATLVAHDMISGKAHRLTAIPKSALQPSLAPDKLHVAFVEWLNKRYVLRIIDVGTGDIRDIAPAWRLTKPSWSPESRSVVFERNAEVGGEGYGSNEVAVASVPAGDVTILARGLAPAWSPNGDEIVFTDIDGKQLQLISPDGKHLRALKRKRVPGAYPFSGPLVWSPNQTALIFHEATGMKGDHPVVRLLDLRSHRTKKLAKETAVIDWR